MGSDKAVPALYAGPAQLLQQVLPLLLRAVHRHAASPQVAPQVPNPHLQRGEKQHGGSGGGQRRGPPGQLHPEVRRRGLVSQHVHTHAGIQGVRHPHASGALKARHAQRQRNTKQKQL